MDKQRVMDEQRRIFLDTEGDHYFQRNSKEIERQRELALEDPNRDPILRALLQFRPDSILEIGAANGWRLDIARRLWNPRCFGIDPSRAAIEDGKRRFPEIDLSVGTADNLFQHQVSCVVFGCCLYLCDSADLFRIATEADRVLLDRGYLMVFDFYPPAPHRNPYIHRSGVYSSKMDYSSLWRWHPSYVLWSQEMAGPDPLNPDERLAMTVLRKVVS